MTYGWHTSAYKWLTDDIGYIRMTYEWHTSALDKIWAHTNDMQMTCEWSAKPYKGFGAFKH